MSLLKSMQNRVSVTKVQQPAPSVDQLVDAFKAAARAADHGKLKPWRFLVVQGEGLQRLSDVFLLALKKSNPNASETIVDKTRNMPFRAPMIIIAIARLQDHIKVPKQEQVIACGAATQNLLNALFDMGFGAVWRSGDMATDLTVMSALDIAASEEILGFIYVGTPVSAVPLPEEIDANAFFSDWPMK